MSKFIVHVLSGTAMIYPNGSAGDGTKANAGTEKEIDISLESTPQSLAEEMQADMTAPAVGVSPPGRPEDAINERTGLVQISCSEGQIKVRTYIGTSYTEQILGANERMSAPMSNSNKITLAVYPVDLPKSKNAPITEAENQSLKTHTNFTPPPKDKEAQHKEKDSKAFVKK